MLAPARQLSAHELEAMRRVTTPLAELAHTPPRPVSRVLIVNADARVVPLIRLHLEGRKYVVDYARSGPDAITKVKELVPDVVLLDVPTSVPGCLDVLRFIRSEKLDMAVIVITSDRSEDLAIEALRSGADDYLRKPFKSQEFETELE